MRPRKPPKCHRCRFGYFREGHHLCWQCTKWAREADRMCNEQSAAVQRGCELLGVEVEEL